MQTQYQCQQDRFCGSYKLNISLFALFILIISIASASQSFNPLESSRPPLPFVFPSNLKQIPISFIPHTQQDNADIYFQISGMSNDLYLTKNGIILSPSTKQSETDLPANISKYNSVRVNFENSNDSAIVMGTERLIGVYNYIHGNNPSEWQINVPTYSGIVYQQIYDGVDLYYNGNVGTLKSTFSVEPSADPRIIHWNYEGATDVKIDPISGNLVVTLPVNSGTPGSLPKLLVEQAPLAWQDIDGHRVYIEAHYTINAGSVGFFIGAYDNTKTLIIDPALSYSSYLGGLNTTNGQDIAVDSQGNIYVLSYTDNTFPTTPGSLAVGDGEISIAKLDRTGSRLIYSTYIGGNHSDVANNMVIDDLGNVYITGRTYSNDFPVVNALQPTCDNEPPDPPGWNRCNSDAFIFKLNSTGSELIFSTYFGGVDVDTGHDIALDSNGDIYIVGDTFNSGVPTTPGVFQESPQGRFDAFIAKMNNQGSGIIYSTFLGGEESDSAVGVAIDLEGNAYITGFSYSINFPTTNGAFQINGSGAFAAKLNSNGGNLVYNTFLTNGTRDFGSDIRIDNNGNAYIVGVTYGGLITANSLQGSLNNGVSGAICNGDRCSDGFVVKLNDKGDSAFYSTYLGGQRNDSAVSVALDGFGNAYIAGSTSSSDFPVIDAFQSTLNGSDFTGDAFVTVIAQDGKSYIYSSFLGGSDSDGAAAIAIDGTGKAYLTGQTLSTDFPTRDPLYGSFQATFSMAFVSIIDAPTISSKDTDGDGLLDAWESQGGGIDVNDDKVIDLDLYALGARPNRKDVFVEIDWMLGYKPSRQSIDDVKTAFAKAPVWDEDSDGDGSQGQVPSGILPGINLIYELDEELAPVNETAYNAVGSGQYDDMFDYRYGSNNASVQTDQNGVRTMVFAGLLDSSRICGNSNGSAKFGSVSERHSPNCVNIIRAKSMVYRYALFIKSIKDQSATGVANLGGSTLLIAQDPVHSVSKANVRSGEAGTFMHELGHTLGLLHGGNQGDTVGTSDDAYNCKPNYFSVMNYYYQLPLADPHRPLDYSSWKANTLDESSLAEQDGVISPFSRTVFFSGSLRNRIWGGLPQTNTPINWNRNLEIDVDRVTGDVNVPNWWTVDSLTERVCKAHLGQSSGTPGQILHGYDDWKNLDLNFRDGPIYPYRGLDASLTVPQSPLEPSVDDLVQLGSHIDFDDDGISNGDDNCPGAYNPDQMLPNDAHSACGELSYASNPVSLPLVVR